MYMLRSTHYMHSITLLNNKEKDKIEFKDRHYPSDTSYYLSTH